MWNHVSKLLQTENRRSHWPFFRFWAIWQPGISLGNAQQTGPFPKKIIQVPIEMDYCMCSKQTHGFVTPWRCRSIHCIMWLPSLLTSTSQLVTSLIRVASRMNKGIIVGKLSTVDYSICRKFAKRSWRACAVRQCWHRWTGKALSSVLVCACFANP